LRLNLDFNFYQFPKSQNQILELILITKFKDNLRGKTKTA